MDNSGAGFTVEIAPSSVGNTQDYYIKVDDFSQLDANEIYTIEVSSCFILISMLHSHIIVPIYYWYIQYTGDYLNLLNNWLYITR